MHIGMKDHSRLLPSVCYRVIFRFVFSLHLFLAFSHSLGKSGHQSCLVAVKYNNAKHVTICCSTTYRPGPSGAACSPISSGVKKKLQVPAVEAREIQVQQLVVCLRFHHWLLWVQRDKLLPLNTPFGDARAQ